VTGRSTQILNAYLTASTDTVIFTAKDYSTGSTIEGVTVGMYRLLNSTLTLVATKTTDITGRVQLPYSVGAKYSFYFDKTGYASRTFSLDPVIFTSYDVFLTALVTEINDYSDVSVTYLPKKYYANSTNNFSIIFNSPEGVLANYSYVLNYPGGSSTGNGVNANGGVFTHSFNIPSTVTLADSVNLSYNFTTVYAKDYYFSARFPISGIKGHTIIALEDNTYGLGVFERVLIAVIASIITAGLASVAVGATFGVTLGLFIMGFFAYVGFLPWMAALISIFVGFVILARRTGD
jgi:5-hydroxyisourate hydrolase-like protein (transthyretin family)